MLITRRHGSWVVLGTLVTEAELERLRAARARLRLVHALHRGLPDRSARRAGHARLDALPLVLDAGARARSPRSTASELGAQVYGCDICQDVCPWNRGIEKRREDAAPPAGAEPHVSLVEWLEAGDEELRERYERLYFPRKDPRYLRRNALVAAGNVGGPELRAAVEAYAGDGDPLLREHAEWALERLDEEPR